MRNFDPTCDRNGVVGVHRLEVITGVGGRRSWSAQDKGRIVAETLAPGANVSEIARRYRLRPQQVYDGRRLARRGMLALPAEDQIGFVPILAADASILPATPRFHAHGIFTTPLPWHSDAVGGVHPIGYG